MTPTFPRPLRATLALALALGFALAGCKPERRLSDQELGLTSEQAHGRRVFDNNCARCHQPYSGRALHGPSLKSVYKKEFLPSGRPANDQRIAETIRYGRDKMPAFGDALTAEQVDALLAYLKTL